MGARRILGYGIGDFGFNLFYTGLNLYLLYYYTDILGIRPELAGLIFMLPVVWDGISDPLMGWVASRTRSRFGRYRPYLLFGAPFMSLSFVAMFAAPLWFPSHMVAACLVSHIIFRTTYTVVSIPYTSLSAAMTTSSQARSSLAGMRMVSAVTGGLFTAFVTLLLAGQFGNGDLATGFVSVAALYGVISAVIMLIVFAATDEGAQRPFQSKITSRQTVHFLSKNTAFWILFGAVFAGSLGNSIASKAMVYYVAYFVGDPTAVSTILTATLGAAAISVPFWAWLARRIDKRTVWIIAGSGGALLAAIQFVIAPRTVDTLLAFQLAGGLFAGGFAVIFWAMLPDTVEFGEWRSRVRDEGIAFGLNQLALKASSGLGVGLLGILLGVIGYQAGQDQSETALEGLRWLTFGVPLVSTLAAVAIISLYPVSARLHARLVRAIERRNAFSLQVDDI
ncbi:MAG: glycoside-pentoside-hexuronide (GPH):cation symporter [Pseudomonadota bacterium]